MNARTQRFGQETAENEVRGVADAWTEAERRGDIAHLGGTLAEDFVGIGPRGFLLTKKEWLARHRTGDLKYESFELADVRVRLYRDAAVLTAGSELGVGADRPPSRSGGNRDHRRRLGRDRDDSKADAGSLVPVLRLLDFLRVLRPLLGGPLAPVARGMGLPLGVRPRVLAGQRRGRHREGEVRPGRDHEGAVRPATSGPERV